MNQKFRVPFLAATDSVFGYIEFSALSKRHEFILHFNNIKGPPSTALRNMQQEFTMSETSLLTAINFVKVCRGLLSSGQTMPTL